MDFKREKKLTLKQKETLVNFMANHKDFAQNKLIGVDGKIKGQQLWTELTVILNKQGPFKTIPKWQRVWTDLKIKAKRKAAGVSYCKNKQTPVVFKYCEEEIVALLANEQEEDQGFTEINHEPDPLLEQQSIKKETIDSWTNHDESETSWQENELNPTEQLNLYSELPKCSYSEHSKGWTQPEDENIPAEVNCDPETISDVKQELPTEINCGDTSDQDKNVAEQAAIELNALTYETNRNILEVKHEISSLNCKVDKFLEQNNVTNVLLSKIAVALEQIAKK